MTSTATYLRVSSKRQAEANSVTAQRAAIEAYLGEEGMCRATEYVDEALTGTSMDRPAFQRMTEAILAGRHDRVVAYSLSRLGRSVAGLAPWCAQIHEHGVELVTVKEGIDCSTPMGRCLLQLVLALGPGD